MEWLIAESFLMNIYAIFDERIAIWTIRSRASISCCVKKYRMDIFVELHWWWAIFCIKQTFGGMFRKTSQKTFSSGIQRCSKLVPFNRHTNNWDRLLPGSESLLFECHPKVFVRERGMGQKWWRYAITTQNQIVEKMGT